MKTPASPRLPSLILLAAFAAGLIPAALRADSAAPPPAAVPAAASDSGSAGVSGDIVTLEPFSVTDEEHSSTTLPNRPVTGLYGFPTAYQDVPRSIAQITPEQ